MRPPAPPRQAPLALNAPRRPDSAGEAPEANGDEQAHQHRKQERRSHVVERLAEAFNQHPERSLRRFQNVWLKLARHATRLTPGHSNPSLASNGRAPGIHQPPARAGARPEPPAHAGSTRGGSGNAGSSPLRARLGTREAHRRRSRGVALDQRRRPRHGASRRGPVHLLAGAPPAAVSRAQASERSARRARGRTHGPRRESEPPMKDARERPAELMALEPPPELDGLVRERAPEVFARQAKPSADAEASDRSAASTLAKLRLARS